MNRLFLISPANCSGERARWLLSPNARSDLAKRLRSSEGTPLGEVFTFMSALYFRGKLGYARAFARPPVTHSGALIITPTAGLVPWDRKIRLSTLRGFSRVPISVTHKLYRSSLLRSVRRLAAEIGPEAEFVLLGSIATSKYLEILQAVFGDRLRIPAEFIGRGDMSRGGLLLRCVKENRELSYIPILKPFTRAAERSRVSRARPSTTEGSDTAVAIAPAE